MNERAAFPAVVKVACHDESRVEVCIADEKLIIISCVCHTSCSPKPWKLFLVISRWHETGAKLICKEGLVTLEFVNKKNFTKLQNNFFRENVSCAFLINCKMTCNSCWETR